MEQRWIDSLGAKSHSAAGFCFGVIKPHVADVRTEGLLIELN